MSSDDDYDGSGTEASWTPVASSHDQHAGGSSHVALPLLRDLGSQRHPAGAHTTGRDQPESEPTVDADQSDNGLATSPRVLPNGWEQFVDPQSGRAYYANRRTGASSWTPPANSESGGQPSSQPGPAPRDQPGRRGPGGGTPLPLATRARPRQYPDRVLTVLLRRGYDEGFFPLWQLHRKHRRLHRWTLEELESMVRTSRYGGDFRFMHESLPGGGLLVALSPHLQFNRPGR